ncbi:hypothetical protein TNIN_466721 [Trichonephila inaurata madagascariensis]|uniref:Uncharacterized protein n=1 Tax=Trichonephila inaurata madagascariensis TaxID=2747483 RepID=A0A8X6ITK2_9ARAC|nr:hypothetical protein TNIN_466721 [Trichonephila inaurata madagascariensis]
MIRGCFALSISCKYVFNLTTDIRKCWTGSANSSVLQTPLTPISRGNDTSSIVLPPSNRQMVVFQHSSSHFDALTCTLRLRTRSRMCVGHSDTHSIPLRNKERV